MNCTTKEVVVRQFSADDWIGIETAYGVRSIHPPGEFTHLRAAIENDKVFLGSEDVMRGWQNGYVNLPNAAGDIIKRAEETIELIDVQQGLGNFYVNEIGASFLAFATGAVSLREAVAQHISNGRRVFLRQEPSVYSFERRTITRKVQLPVNEGYPVIAMLGLEVVVIQEPGVISVKTGQSNIRFLLNHGWRFFALRNVTNLQDSTDITEAVADHYKLYATPDAIYPAVPGLVILHPLVRVDYHSGGIVEVTERDHENRFFVSATECAEYYLAAGHVVIANVIV